MGNSMQPQKTSANLWPNKEQWLCSAQSLQRDLRVISLVFHMLWTPADRSAGSSSRQNDCETQEGGGKSCEGITTLCILSQIQVPCYAVKACSPAGRRIARIEDAPNCLPCPEGSCPLQRWGSRTSLKVCTLLF